ncbi:hypothetical protein A1O3_09366 [Capronia epimyces CBS 606.96]|uniref:Yeast cell wall synthesis Kre9/Knh1-like N-terminal domain-containing protein n=1 Tax=Capronia epimyces CBS 606.96 TaxID=1182542 RepID=W9XLJ2_9EURO|nr:uncharacterized protein A1O3_09366 [Capronia epimyces CBS 606.96]EXJ78205.1 hypothetical protein A1O3_09366 [Capronia epimyces CBS 606.96]
MRFLATVVAALCVAVVAAQKNNAISIPEGQSTLDVTAGKPLTIDWTNPSSGTVTIKLAQDPITPDSGVVLASGVPASDKTATLQIPAADDVNSHLYTIEIIDDTDSSNTNFSPNFGIQGATGTGTGSVSTASSTGTASTASKTSTNSTATDSSAASSAAATSSAAAASSSAAATSDSASSSESASTSATSSQAESSSTSSAAPTETTSVPSSNTNAGSGLKIQGGVLAMAVGLVVAL